MTTIYKFTISEDKISEYTSLYIPKGAKILTCQMQGRDMCLWAEVDTDVEREHRYFGVFGTGNPLENFSPKMGGQNNMNYVATVQYNHGLVWHIYEYI